MSERTSTVTRLALAGGIALAVFVAWLATASQVNAGLAFFYAVPVGLVAWWWGGSAGAAAVLVATGLYAVGAQIHPVPDFGVALALRLGAFAGVAAVVAALRERVGRLQISAEELEAIRAALAPAELPRVEGVDAAAAFAPSELGVSGDFHLLTEGPIGSVVAIVGDVAGHGPPAARLATFVRARLAALAASTDDPVELLELANAALMELPGRKLVSAICLRFDPASRRLIWAAAGHPPPLRLPELVELELEGPTFLLGAESELALESHEISLAPGEGILAYTDGATDVRRGGEMLGLDGLRRLVAPVARSSAKALVEHGKRAILEWSESPIRDDFCLLALRPNGETT